MRKDIKLDGVSFNADLVRSFQSEKDCVDYFLTPKHAHHWPGLSKKELTAKYKLLYKLCKADEMLTPQEIEKENNNPEFLNG